MSAAVYRRSARCAFTLIEMVIVVLVMGILLSVATPKYSAALAAYRLETASRRVAADLRLARTYAQKVSAAQAVDFDAAAETYAMPGAPDIDRPNNPYSVNLAASQYGAQIVSAVFGPADRVQFDMFGRPDRSGSVVVQVGTAQKTVEVDDFGNVRIL